MPADMNRRQNRILVGLSQNEALMEDLDANAASTLLDWASTLARAIVYETIELDNEEAADKAMYPRLRALRQMMKQVNLLACSDPQADPEPATATLDLFITQASTVYGAQLSLPTPESRLAFLNTPPANTADWIASLRTWLEISTPLS